MTGFVLTNTMTPGGGTATHTCQAEAGLVQVPDGLLCGGGARRGRGRPTAGQWELRHWPIVHPPGYRPQDGQLRATDTQNKTSLEFCSVLSSLLRPREHRDRDKTKWLKNKAIAQLLRQKICKQHQKQCRNHRADTKCAKAQAAARLC